MSKQEITTPPSERIELYGSTSSLATFFGIMIFCALLTFAIAALLIIGPKMDSIEYGPTAKIVLLLSSLFFFLISILALWTARRYWALLRYKEPFYIFDANEAVDTLNNKTIKWDNVSKIDYAPLIPSVFLTLLGVFVPIIYIFFWGKICRTNMSFIYSGEKNNFIKIKWSLVKRAQDLPVTHEFISAHIPSNAQEVQN